MVEATLAQRGSDSQVSGVSERLQALEDRPAEVPAVPDLDEVNARLGQLESAFGVAGSDPRVEDLSVRLASLERKTDQPDQDPRIGEITLRLNALEEGVRDGGDAGVAELAARLQSIEGSVEGGSDPRVTEVISRLDLVQRELQDSISSGDPAKLTERIADLEQAGANGGGAGAYQPELLARMEDVEKRLSQTEQSGGGGGRQSFGRAGDCPLVYLGQTNRGPG